MWPFGRRSGEHSRVSGFLQPRALLNLPLGIRYAIPVLTAALVYLFHLYMLAGSGISPFVFFNVGVAISAWLGGRLPGLLAVVLSTALASTWLLGPLGWSFLHPDLLETLFFVTGSTAVALVCAGFREAARRTHRAADDLARIGAEASQKEERLRAIFEGAALGMVEGDAEGRLQNVNQRFCDMLGYRKDELIGISIHDLTAPEDRKPARDFNDQLLRHEIDRYAYDKRYLAKDGHPVWVHVTVSALRDTAGAVARVVGTVEDITELRQAKARLEEANARKSEFLAVLSHELRNPLAPIRNSLYIIDRVPPGGEQAKRAHQVIDRQVRHLTRLVDDLLDVTRISRGKVQLRRERVELGALASRTAEDHRSLFATAGVTFTIRDCDTPLFIEGDVTRLSQVIGNLLTNAAKFTPPGGQVELLIDREEDSAVVRVRDSGVGIAASVATKLFEPFVQADATLDRSKGGLGLGLALVKGLVELHGGTVAAHSQGPGAGAEFIVRLPIEAMGGCSR
jgi:PAS domain S-box-containing protein